MGAKVILHLYDLSPSNDYLYPIGFGLHHSGVEVCGDEYSFASGAGIFSNSPKQEAPNTKFRESIELGAFDGGPSDLKVVLSQLREADKFGPDDYNLVRNNCNHFANALVWKLLGRKIPPHINRLADLGVCCSCLLPKQLLEAGAPVGDEASSNSSGFQVLGNRASRQATAKAPSFAGSGARLGGPSSATAENKKNGGLTSRLFSSSSSNRSPSPRADEVLTDRRERARKAAMARMDQHQQQANKVDN
jgi:hypothetical protein